MNTETNLAVLIDADNVSYHSIKAIMEEAAKFGVTTIRRAYGDWTNPEKGRWKQVLLENAITPIQQYSYTHGKNATDSAMIIDAMDLLYSGKVQGFCIISSDSDFTRLATRLREAGMYVVGMGEQKTPRPFVAACDKFVYVEVLGAPTEDASATDKESAKSKSKTQNGTKTKKPTKSDFPPDEDVEPEALTFSEAVELLASSIDDVADDDGWAFLGAVGNMATKRRPDFDSRLFGFSKLSQLIATIDRFEIEERPTNHRNTKHVYIRDRLSK